MSPDPLTPEAKYTPTTENVRNCYVYSHEAYDGSLATPVYVATAEFDRWLASVKAEAAATALEAVITQMKMAEKRMPDWKHPMTLEPTPPHAEFVRGYREARYKTQHILGVMQAVQRRNSRSEVK